MHGICTAWCRKIHPWSLLRERRDASIQGMKDLHSVYSPLYSLLLKQLFCYAVCYWTFFTEIQNKLCTALPLLAPTLLPRAEHPNSPSSDSYTLPVLHSCNCMAIILSILIFIHINLFLYPWTLLGWCKAVNTLETLHVFCRLQLIQHSICNWATTDY